MCQYLKSRNIKSASCRDPWKLNIGCRIVAIIAMITIGPSRTMNGICLLKSLPLNPPLSSTTRNALRMEMVRTASTRPTFGSPLFQVILRNSKPQRQHTIQRRAANSRYPQTYGPHRPYSTPPVRQTRSSKARRGLKEKTRKTKPTHDILTGIFPGQRYGCDRNTPS